MNTSPFLSVPYDRLSTVKGLIDYLEELKLGGVELLLRLPDYLSDLRRKGIYKQYAEMVHISDPSTQLDYDSDKRDWLYYICPYTKERYACGSHGVFYLTATVRAWDPLMVPPAYSSESVDLQTERILIEGTIYEQGQEYFLIEDQNYYGGEIVPKGSKLVIAGYTTVRAIAYNRQFTRKAYAKYPDGTYRSFFAPSSRLGGVLSECVQ